MPRLCEWAHPKASRLHHPSQTSQWQREMLFIWSSPFHCLFEQKRRKAMSEKRLACSWTLGCLSLLCTCPITHPLDVPTLKFISEVKVEWNYYCSGNFLRFPVMTTDAVKWVWALNLGFTPLEEGKVREHLLSVHCESGTELCTLHVLFPWTLDRTHRGRHSHPCFQIKLSRLKKSKKRRVNVFPRSQGHEW